MPLPKIKLNKLFLLPVFSILLIILAFVINSPQFDQFMITRSISSNRLGVSTEGPKTIEINGKTRVKYSEDYTIVLLGDSMTAALGNSDELRFYLKELYPGKTFEVLNYGFGSTNITSVPDRLTKDTFYFRTFRPINDIAYDLIIIESFAYNPLAHLELNEGLKLQTATLDQTISLIKEANPNAKVVFLATIAPNKYKYAEGVVETSLEQRQNEVSERIAYFQNHIDYAFRHNIPLINVYQKSVDDQGVGKLEYINKDDFIHPSTNGIFLISKEIANFLYQENILN